MGKMTLVTGGARSGKSSYAEKIMRDLNGNILYIATAIPYDDEMKLRIKKHREQRPSNWDTYEGHIDLGKVLIKKGVDYDGVLLDCITIMTTNLMFDFIGEKDIDKVNFQDIENKILIQMEQLVEGIKSIDSHVVLVTNELGSGVVPESKLGRIFRDIAGRVNQYLGSKSDEVFLTVCGIPTQIK